MTTMPLAPHAREPRYPFPGKVRLLVDFAPWRVLLSLDGLDLSTSGVRARLPAAVFAQFEDAEALLQERQLYDLQLEFAADHLPDILLKGRLVRRRRLTGVAPGWDLAFMFLGSDFGLLGLVHELALAAGEHEGFTASEPADDKMVRSGGRWH